MTRVCATASRVLHEAVSLLTDKWLITIKIAPWHRPSDGARLTGSAIRQVAPVLRKWVRSHLMAGPAAEALCSPLTFTSGLFDARPCIHAAL